MAAPQDPTQFTYSVVVPVYNSEGIVGETVDRIVAEFEQQGLRYELILVNDGSRDGSWEVIADKARENPHVVALNLLRNYGQHNANLAGFREATGDYVITMDDDLQNPPDQTLLLIDEAMTRPRRRVRPVREQEGRRLPAARQQADRDDQPPHLRPAQRPGRLQLPDPAPRRGRPDLRLADGVPLHHRPGAAVLQQPRQRARSATSRARSGTSTYSMTRILRLVFTILFSYSSFPLRLAAAVGFVIAR